ISLISDIRVTGCQCLSQIGASLHAAASGVPPSCVMIRGMSVRTFQSWKEIADHMGRGVRTVQRWEAFGLPVHRPAGRERSAVFAIEHELDSWMQQTHTQLGKSIQSNGEANGNALVARIRELENEVAVLREQISFLTTFLDGEAHAA